MVMILYYSILIPLQATVILIWYIVNEITKDEEEWYKFSSTSLIMVLTQVYACHCPLFLNIALASYTAIAT